MFSQCVMSLHSDLLISAKLKWGCLHHLRLQECVMQIQMPLRGLCLWATARRGFTQPWRGFNRHRKLLGNCYPTIRHYQKAGWGGCSCRTGSTLVLFLGGWPSLPATSSIFPRDTASPAALPTLQLPFQTIATSLSLGFPICKLDLQVPGDLVWWWPWECGIRQILWSQDDPEFHDLSELLFH
jgi:hypothetical protein